MSSRRDEMEQIFETCLELIQSGQETLETALARYPEAAEELRPRLEAAIWLEERKGSLEPRPGFVSASRSRLVSQIKGEMAAQAAVAEAPKESILALLWRQLVPQGPGARRKFAFQLALILVFLFSTVAGGRQIAFIAQDAIPGDPLYPVKITLERVEMITTFDLAEEIRLHVEFANNRLVEVQELVLEGRYAYIPQTLARFGAQVNQAVSKLEVLARRDADKALAMAAFMHDSLSDQAMVLGVLMDTVPLAIQPDIAQALNVTGSAIIVVEDVGTQAGGTSAPTPTSDISAESDGSSSSNTPTDTPSSSPTLTATGTQTLTPSPTITSTATPLGTLLPTNTPTPGSGGGEEPVDPTATQQPDPTDEPTDEPEPTATKKPLPNPTRRPPKPTKETNK